MVRTYKLKIDGYKLLGVVKSCDEETKRYLREKDGETLEFIEISELEEILDKRGITLRKLLQDETTKR